MRAVRRAISALIFILPLAALVTVGVIVVRRYYQRAERDLEPVLAAELSRVFGHETRVGRVTIERKTATVSDVHVALGPTFRASGNREMASARRIVLDFDLRQILLEENPRIPYVASARVLDPVALIIRDASGKWNFADIFRPRKVKPARPAVGTVVVERGHLLYQDAAPPHHVQRTAAPISAEFREVSGSMQFYPDDSVTWTAAGDEETGLAAKASVLGSYDPTPRRLYLRIMFDQLALRSTSRFLPPGDEVTAGTGSGKLTLWRNGSTPFDYQVDAKFDRAAIDTKRIAEPATGISGAATVSNSVATARLDGTVAGSLIHAEGSVFDFQRPVVNGWASGSDLRIAQVIHTLKLGDRFKYLRDFEARGSAHLEMRGDIRNPIILGQAQALARGGPAKGAVAATTPLAVTFSGPLNQPRITAVGTIPSIRYRQYAGQYVHVSAALNANTAAIDFAGSFATGLVAGRVNFDLHPKRERYTAQIRARGISLDSIPPSFESQKTHLAGTVDADASLDGSFEGGRPRGIISVQVSRLKYNEWACDRAQAQARASGDVLHLDSFTARLGNGIVVADGDYNFAAKEVDLKVQADEIDLDRLPLSSQPDVAVPITGLVYLRNARITGNARDPYFEGQVRGYDIAPPGRPQIDYVAATLRGDRQSLTIQGGQAWRFPAYTSVEGVIHRPLSHRAQMEISGGFDKVDMQDLADLAGTKLDASGIARGEWRAEGYLIRPVVSAEGVRIDEPAIGETGFDSLVLDLVYDATSGRSELRIPAFTAVTRAATITGHAGIDENRAFNVFALSNRVKLNLLQPYVGEYVTLEGEGNVVADVKGRIEEGKVTHLGGTVRADTQGLTVNQEPFGEAHAILELDGEFVRSHEASLSGASGKINVVNLAYDRTTRGIEGAASISQLSLDALRRAVSASPYVIKHPLSFAASRLKPITYPFSGEISARVGITGTTVDPEATIAWNVPPNSVVIEGQPIKEFQGTVRLTRDLVDLRSAKLIAETTVVKAHGIFVPDKRLEGEVDFNNIPLSVLRRWFPDSSLLFRLADIKDPLLLAERFRDAQDAVTIYLRSRMSSEARQLLEAYRGPLKPSEELLLAIIRSLNDEIQSGPALYTPERFARVDLSADLKSRIATSPSGRGRTVANRLLIAEAYPIELQQGLPERPMLEGLSGMANKVDIVSTGNPSAPSLTATVDLSNVAWADPDGQVLGGRPIEIEQISSSPIQIGGGKIRVDDIEFRIVEPNRPVAASSGSGGALKPPGPEAAPARSTSTVSQKGKSPVTSSAVTLQAITPPGPYEAHLRDSAFDFSWESLGIPENGAAKFKLVIDKQGLGIFTTLARSAPRVLDGTVTASLQYDGPVSDLSYSSNASPLARGLETRITGSIDVQAPRIGFNAMSTELRNLDASLTFTGAKVHVEHFSLQTQVVHPRYASKLSEPLTIEGDLAVRNPSAASGLTVRANKLVFGEGPLPGVGSGAAVGEASTRSTRAGANAAEALRITGTLFEPTLAGNVYLRNAWMRMPDTFRSEKLAPFVLPVSPQFALRFVTDNDVRISTSQMNAYVRTSGSEPVELTGTVTSPRLAGSLVIERGTLSFPTARFTIQRGGRVALRYPAALSGSLLDTGLAVNVDLTAVTRITSSSVNGVPRRYTITVEARGPLNSNEQLQIIDPSEIGTTSGGERGLRLTFRSDPPDLALSSAGLRRRITGILGGQGAIEELFGRNPNVARAVTEQFTDILSASMFPELLERTGIARVLGFEELTFEYNRLDAFTLRISRQLIGPLYASYWRRLSGANLAGNIDRAAWELKLSYRLANNIQFSWTSDEQRTNALLVEGVFRY